MEKLASIVGVDQDGNPILIYLGLDESGDSIMAMDEAHSSPYDTETSMEEGRSFDDLVAYVWGDADWRLELASAAESERYRPFDSLNDW